MTLAVVRLWLAMWNNVKWVKKLSPEHFNFFRCFSVAADYQTVVSVLLRCPRCANQQLLQRGENQEHSSINQMRTHGIAASPLAGLTLKYFISFIHCTLFTHRSLLGRECALSRGQCWKESSSGFATYSLNFTLKRQMFRFERCYSLAQFYGSPSCRRKGLIYLG